MEDVVDIVGVLDELVRMKSAGLRMSLALALVSPPNVCKPVWVQSSLIACITSTRLLRGSLKWICTWMGNSPQPRLVISKGGDLYHQLEKVKKLA